MGQGSEWPAHAYIPGKTQRHHEDAFDHLTATAKPGMSIAELSDSDAFQFGLKYLTHGFYWEAHELFEPVWMALPNPSRERTFVQGLIQIANGFLKLKMDRPNAARRLDGIAQTHITQAGSGVIMGVSHQDVLEMLVALKSLTQDAL